MKNKNLIKLAAIASILPIVFVVVSTTANAAIDTTEQHLIQTGTLTVYVFPGPTVKEVNAQTTYQNLVSFVGQNFVDDRNYGASTLGQYNNEGNIIAGKDTVRFVIHPDVKKSDGTTLTVDDISDEMLFGNGVTHGSILLADETGVGATFFVTDQHYDSLFESKMSDIKARLPG